MDTQEQLSPLLKEFSGALSFAADFKDYFRQILEFLKKMKTENEEEMTAVLTAMKRTADRMIEEMEEGNTTDMERKKKEMMIYCVKEMDKMMKDCETKMAEMDKKMSEVRDGLDADEVRVAENASKMAVSEVLKQIPTIEAIEEDLPKLGGSIASSLELLPEEKKLEIFAIKGLKQLLEELKNRPVRLGGGGFSKMALDGHILDPYVPSGTINGVNTDFLCTNIPSPTASLKVYRGGALQSINEDYTLSNLTITFIVPPVVGEVIKVEHRI